MLNFTDALKSTSHRFAFRRHHAINTITGHQYRFTNNFTDNLSLI